MVITVKFCAISFRKIWMVILTLYCKLNESHNLKIGDYISQKY